MALYNPDQTARNTWTEPASEAFRTQRDVGLLIPTNFLINPTVSLRAACFGKNQYEDAAFQKCFSNLLAVGFRKFIVDVYWDASRLEWSLCPAEIPPSATSTLSTISATSTSAASSSTPPIVGSSSTLSGSLEGTRTARTARTVSPGLKPRQTSSASGSSTSSRTSIASSEATPTGTPLPPPPTQQSNNLFSIGSYNCTSTITLRLFTGIFESFLDQTSTTTDAVLVFTLLNIHAASSWAAPDDPAQRPVAGRLPIAGNMISDVVKGNLTDELYTPQRLQQERANLDDNWYKVRDENMPAPGYYQVEGSSGHQITKDGWPTEAYLEFQELYRLVASVGTIDPQMSAYDLAADAATIFPNNTLFSEKSVSINAEGTVSSGCLFAPRESSITSSTNSSWAVATVPTINIGSKVDYTQTIPSVANLTSCGISPFLNSTISNVTADKAPLPYAAFVQSTLWSWAPGQPQNGSKESTTLNRCAVMHLAPPHAGRWFTADCIEQHRIACQDPSRPYAWTVSSSEHTYADADSACERPFSFHVPHTALENAHLLANASAMSPSLSPIFLNVNSLDVEGCWVRGINDTCPYKQTPDTDRTRVVVVPTVAAVIVFVLAVLTFFVKCAANRREDKRGRRRRMVGGWEYEGVPS